MQQHHDNLITTRATTSIQRKPKALRSSNSQIGTGGAHNTNPLIKIPNTTNEFHPNAWQHDRDLCEAATEIARVTISSNPNQSKSIHSECNLSRSPRTRHYKMPPTIPTRTKDRSPQLSGQDQAVRNAILTHNGVEHSFVPRFGQMKQQQGAGEQRVSNQRKNSNEQRWQTSKSEHQSIPITSEFRRCNQAQHKSTSTKQLSNKKTKRNVLTTRHEYREYKTDTLARRTQGSIGKMPEGLPDLYLQVQSTEEE